MVHSRSILCSTSHGNSSVEKPPIIRSAKPLTWRSCLVPASPAGNFAFSLAPRSNENDGVRHYVPLVNVLPVGVVPGPHFDCAPTGAYRGAPCT